MRIAVVSSTERGETDRLISQTADFLLAQGAKLTGIVKVLEDEEDPSCACDMAVRVLPEGLIIPITQDLGDGSDACKLDPGAIARAVNEVEKQPLEGVQLFILNKFGPEEAEGRGFRAAIGAALEAGIPVLVGVGGPSRAAFDTFVDGLAEALPPDAGAIRDWCHGAMS
ncbi:MAG: DUF2478 domain-containing protein [Marinosulfonomonas sp.]|nr:DUF2478 domain-containing protein [Marinosulfonomonas sp.]